eukprot:766089-Hanusia_phi.AAC.3
MNIIFNVTATSEAAGSFRELKYWSSCRTINLAFGTTSELPSSVKCLTTSSKLSDVPPHQPLQASGSCLYLSPP